MRRLILAALIALGFANGAVAQTVTAAGSTAVAFGTQALGQVTNGCYFNDQPPVAAAAYINSITAHDVFDDIASFQVVYPNWSGTSGEASLGTAGGSINVVAEVGGVLYPVTFGGVSSPTMGGAASLKISDPIVAPVKRGSRIYLHVQVNYPGGVPFMSKSIAIRGERSEYSSSALTSRQGQTVAQAITAGWGNPTGSGAIFRPVAIIAQTRMNSLGIVGTSRQAIPNSSSSDTAYSSVGDPTGNMGEIARSTGSAAPVLSLAVSGSTLQNYLGSHTLKDQVLAWVTHIATDYTGINDITVANRTGAQVVTDMGTFAALYSATKPVYFVTSAPLSTSTDGFATTANQTATTFNAQLTIAAEAVRAGISGASGYFDVRALLSTGRNTDVWLADGTAGKWTGDGIHETTYANKMIQASGIVRIPGINAGNVYRP
jgi:hypothetical protein